MTEKLKSSIRDRAGVRWFVLILVSVTMLLAYTFIE